MESDGPAFELVETPGQCLGALDVALLRPFAAAAQQDHEFLPLLHEVDAKARANVDAHLAHPLTNWSNLAQQPGSQPLDSCDDAPRWLLSLRPASQSVRKLGEWLDRRHTHNVIVRLRNGSCHSLCKPWSASQSAQQDREPEQLAAWRFRPVACCR